MEGAFALQALGIPVARERSAAVGWPERRHDTEVGSFPATAGANVIEKVRSLVDPGVNTRGGVDTANVAASRKVMAFLMLPAVSRRALVRHRDKERQGTILHPGIEIDDGFHREDSSFKCSVSREDEWVNVQTSGSGLDCGGMAAGEAVRDELDLGLSRPRVVMNEIGAGVDGGMMQYRVIPADGFR